MQCLGRTAYHDIDELNKETLFNESIGRSISEETLRQKLDFVGENFSYTETIDSSNLKLLKIGKNLVRWKRVLYIRY